MSGMQILKYKNECRGFTLIEVLVYMSILAVIVAIIIGSLMVVAEVQERVIAGKTLDRSANIAIDRFLREVRESDFINFDESVFDNPDGVLVALKADGSGEIRFYIGVNDELLLEKNSELLRLNHDRVRVDSFILREVSAGDFDAVKMEIVLSHPYGGGVLEQAFYSTAILRGSYGQ